MIERSTAREGMALVLAVVILAMVTAMMGIIAWQTNAARRLLNSRQQQLQAIWLARSGIEYGYAHLAAEPEHYKEESIELIPLGQVLISVERDPKSRNHFRITCQARYPSNEPRPQTRTLSCELNRHPD
jgi:hypothetical protein